MIGSLVTLCLLGGLWVLITRSSQRVAGTLWLLVFLTVVGGGVTMMCAHSFVAKWGFRGDSERDGLISMMDGTAHRPFVYRRLTPDLVSGLTSVILAHAPASAKNYVVEESPLKRYRASWTGGEGWGLRKAIAFHVAYLLVWLTFFGALVASAALVRVVGRRTWMESVMVATLGATLLPLLFVNGAYLYDGTELFLWFTLLLASVTVTPARSVFVVLLFGLMLVNKESAVLVALPLFPLFVKRLGWRVAAALTVGLGIVGTAWLFFVRHKYAPQPGSPMEFWLPSNLRFWGSPSSYFKFGTPYAPVFPTARGGNVLLLLLLLLPCRFGWKTLSSELRVATLVALAVFLPLFLIAGHDDEVRGLALLVPFGFLVAVQGVQAMFGPPRTTALTSE